MDDVATKEMRPRRVGFNEGLQHIVGAAAGLAAIALRFPGGAAAAALAGGALLWMVGYTILRLARQRIWFGAWDALSFGFVWGYAVTLALAMIMLAVQWT